MADFDAAVRAWSTGGFEASLKRALLQLGPGVLPLAQGVGYGGTVDDSDLTVTVLRSGEDGGVIVADIGVFFTEIIGGCSCGDEPAPLPAYCEVRVRIDTATATVAFALIAD